MNQNDLDYHRLSTADWRKRRKLTPLACEKPSLATVISWLGIGIFIGILISVIVFLATY